MRARHRFISTVRGGGRSKNMTFSPLKIRIFNNNKSILWQSSSVYSKKKKNPILLFITLREQRLFYFIVPTIKYQDSWKNIPTGVCSTTSRIIADGQNHRFEIAPMTNDGHLSDACPNTAKSDFLYATRTHACNICATSAVQMIIYFMHALTVRNSIGQRNVRVRFDAYYVHL
jgi:hypothetical protein